MTGRHGAVIAPRSSSISLGLRSKEIAATLKIKDDVIKRQALELLEEELSIYLQMTANKPNGNWRNEARGEVRKAAIVLKNASDSLRRLGEYERLLLLDHGNQFEVDGPSIINSIESLLVPFELASQQRIKRGNPRNEAMLSLVRRLIIIFTHYRALKPRFWWNQHEEHWDGELQSFISLITKEVSQKSNRSLSGYIREALADLDGNLTPLVRKFAERLAPE